MALDLNSNVYLAVSFNPTSSFVVERQTFSLPRYESVSDEGPVGSLADVKLLKIPKEIWRDSNEDILSALKSDENVLRVDVQEPKMRSKRRDEF